MKRPLVALLSSYLVCALACVSMSRPARMAVLAAAAVLLTACVFFLRIKHKAFFSKTTATALKTAAVVLSGILIAAVQFNFLSPDKTALSRQYDGREVTLTGEVVRAEPKDYGTLLYLNADTIDEKACDEKIVLAVYRNDKIKEGYRLECTATLKTLKNTGFRFDAVRYYKGENIFLAGTALQILSLNPGPPSLRSAVLALREQMIGYGNRLRYSAFVNALILGDRSGIDSETAERFNLLGISHILSISGLHLSLIIMTFFTLLRRITVKKQIASLLSILLTLFYMLLTGFSYTVVRSGIMLIVIFASYLFRKSSDSTTALFLSAGVLVLINPCALYNIGFLLSFCSTLGILCLSPPATEAYRKSKLYQYFSAKNSLPFRLLRLLTGSVAVGLVISLSAMLFSLPVLLLFYSRIALIAPLANLFFVFPFNAVILFSFVYMIFCLLCGPMTAATAVFGFLADLLGKAIDLWMDLLLRAILYVSDLRLGVLFVDYPFIPYFAVFTVLVLLFFLFARPRLHVCLITAGLLFALLPVCITIYHAIHIDDIGAVFLGTRESEFMLLTCRDNVLAVEAKTYDYPRNSALASLLDASNVQRIHHYFISGYGGNTVNRISYLLKKTEIDNLYCPQPSCADDARRYRALEAFAEERKINLILYRPRDDFSLSETLSVSVWKKSGAFCLYAVRVKDKNILYAHNDQKGGVLPILEESFDFLRVFGKTVKNIKAVSKGIPLVFLSFSEYAFFAFPDGFYDADLCDYLELTVEEELTAAGKMY